MTGVVFLDLKKAFDTVDHSIVIHKLATFGLGQNTRNWFQLYLKDRHQAVRHNGVTSNLRLIKCGVPQGSILGPQLYNVHK